MNKVYSLKYSPVTGGLIAVSEIVRRVTVGRENISAILLSVAVTATGVINPALAADLNISQVWARDYLDLAQNKGIFKAGATDVKLPLKNGEFLTFPEFTIPDFSAASSKGATTAIGGAYSVTATHNGIQHHAVQSQTWGQTTYNLVDRMTKSGSDFAVQRLNKFVVETTGITEFADFNLNETQALERYGVEFNGKKQIIGFRAGAGTTLLNQQGKNHSTGELYNPDLLSASMFNLDWNTKRIFSNVSVFDNETTGGDSGSGIYIFDNNKKQWVLLGTTQAIASYHNSKQTDFTMPGLYEPTLVNSIKTYFLQEIPLNNARVNIITTGYSINNNTSPLPLTDNKKHNKDMKFTGGGTVNLSGI